MWLDAPAEREKRGKLMSTNYGHGQDDVARMNASNHFQTINIFVLEKIDKMIDKW